MKNEHIIEKIRKLLALAQNSNEHESAAALAKVNSLLISYNLTMKDIERTSKQAPKFHVHKFKIDKDIVHEYLAQIIMQHFFVQIIDTTGRSGTFYSFVGEYSNVDIAQYVYNFLHSKFHNFWLAFIAKNNCSDSAYTSYINGLYDGLDQKLNDSRMALASNCKALAVMRNELVKHCESMSEGWQENFDTKQSTNEKIYSSGFRTGQKIEITKPIANTRQQAKQIA
jgi:hypothetical protein